MSKDTDAYMEIAQVLDKTDPLAKYRDQFSLPSDTIYLDGNSLGAMPVGVPQRLTEAAEKEWGRDLIASWNKAGWIDLPKNVGSLIAPIIGANEDNVIVTDSTSVNAFKVLAAALLINNKRRKIVSEAGNFPTDLYMIQALTAFLGMEHELVMAEDDLSLMDAIDDETAVVFLTQVDYRTGRKHNLKSMTELAHKNGALMIWDLAHSAGAFPLDIEGSGVDFAIGCGYKYLNGGPGAPSFIYVKPELQTKTLQPLSGWFAHESPFAFEPKFKPAHSIKRYLTGTPPVLSMIALEKSLGVFKDVNMQHIYAKSVGMTQLFAKVVADLGNGLDLMLVSPAEPERRGSQLSYSSDFDCYAIIQALIAEGVVGDFRTPNILRFGFAPLYNSYSEAVTAAQKLVDIVESGRWDTDEFKVRKAVT